MIIVSEENKRGGMSVQMEHIFPVIKKWLYSEKEIFLREIVSNACDAATKLKRLYSLGEAKDTDIESLKIKVVLDSTQKTITVSDNGIRTPMYKHSEAALREPFPVIVKNKFFHKSLLDLFSRTTE